MGATTTVDEERDKLESSIRDACASLTIILDKDTWGHTDLNDSYVDQLFEIQATLLKIKRKI